MILFLLFLSSVLFNSSLFADFAYDAYNTAKASYYESAGDLTRAYECYKKIATSSVDCPYKFKGAVSFLFNTGNYDKIIQVVPDLDTAFKDDATMQRIFALSYKQGKNVAEGNRRIIELSRQFKGDHEITFHAAAVFVELGDHPNAIAIIDDLLNRAPQRPNTFIFHFLKAQIYSQMLKPHDALKSVEASLSLYPGFDKGLLLKAALHEELGFLIKAADSYTRYLQVTGRNKQIEKHVVDLISQYELMQKQKNPFAPAAPFQTLHLLETQQYETLLDQIGQQAEINAKSARLRMRRKPKTVQQTLLQICSTINHTLISRFSPRYAYYS